VVGVMKDEDLKIEESEDSHTLGGPIRYTYIFQSHWFRHRTGGLSTGLVVSGLLFVYY
jgi:hypothetical protein